MSHTTRRKSAIKDLPTLKKAVDRVPGAEYQGIGHGRDSKQGHQVKLPGWHYPVTFDLTTGEATFDNYNGNWGKNDWLDKLQQGYAVEAAKAKAAEQNREIEEYVLPDGGIKLVIPLGGGGYGVGEGEATSGGYGV